MFILYSYGHEFLVSVVVLKGEHKEIKKATPLIHGVKTGVVKKQCALLAACLATLVQEHRGQVEEVEGLHQDHRLVDELVPPDGLLHVDLQAGADIEVADAGGRSVVEQAGYGRGCYHPSHEDALLQILFIICFYKR